MTTNGLSLNQRPCETSDMRPNGATPRKYGPIALAELVGRALDPVTARRGFATSELVAGWAEIVGVRYADCSRPERIAWPRGAANKEIPGTLVVAVQGPRALFFQHEADQVIERVNAYLGHSAVGTIKIVQQSVPARTSARASDDSPLDAEDQTKLENTLANIESPDLHSALDRLGRAILAERNKKT